MCSELYDLLTLKEVCHGWQLWPNEVMSRVWRGELDARDTYEEVYLFSRVSVERVFGSQKRELVAVFV